MGIWDFFRRSSAPPEPDDTAPGWDAIEDAFERLYPGQASPIHVAPAIRRAIDPSDHPAAFDGISAYDAGDRWHFVTFGLTELYRKIDDDPAISGAGFELTLVVPKTGDRPPPWAFELLEALGQAFWRGDHRWVPDATMVAGPLANGPNGPVMPCLLARDAAIPEPIHTPHGRVVLLRVLPIEETQRQRLVDAAQRGGPTARAAELERVHQELLARGAVRRPT